MYSVDQPLSESDQVLLVGDQVEENKQIGKVIRDAKLSLVTVTEESECPRLISLLNPKLLIFAYRDIVKSEQVCTALLSIPKEVPADIACARLLVCKPGYGREALAMCREGIFDDYVVTPIADGDPQLQWAVELCLERLQTRETLGRAKGFIDDLVSEFTEMNLQLKASIAKGSQINSTAWESVERTANLLAEAVADLEQGFDSKSSESGQRRESAAGRRLSLGLNKLVQQVCPELQTCRKHLEQSGAWFETIDAWQRDQPKPERDTTLRRIYDVGQQETGKGIAVMVVEDEPFYRELLNQILTGSGFTVHSAVDGKDALDQLAGCQPDLILMDLMMPNLDGLQTLVRLKTRPQWSGIPIIMLTGVRDREIVKECIRRGAVDYAIKPFKNETILRKVTSHLKASKP